MRRCCCAAFGSTSSLDVTACLPHPPTHMLTRRRTYKFLRGVLAAAAVVTDAWPAACLQRGAPVDVTEFLVSCRRRQPAAGAGLRRPAGSHPPPALPATPPTQPGASRPRGVRGRRRRRALFRAAGPAAAAGGVRDLHGRWAALAGLARHTPALWQGLPAPLPSCLARADPPAAACCPPAGEFANGSEVRALLQAAGAKCLPRPPASCSAAAHGGPPSALLLCDVPDARSSPAAAPQRAQQEGTGEAGGRGVGPAPPAVAGAKWFRKAAEAGVPVAVLRWLLDSIGSYTVRPLAPYRL